MDKTKIIVTLGPATRTENDLRMIKSRGVDFVRINMSHSSIDDLKYFIQLAKKVDVPFIIDTEGSQIRTGELNSDQVAMTEGEEVKIYNTPIRGNAKEICLKPGLVVSQLEKGDIIHIDFDSLALVVSDTSPIADGYISARVISGGVLGKNKATIINSGLGKKFSLAPLSEKDLISINIGLEAGINYIAASFMRSREFVEKVRLATGNKMKIISKVECTDALENLEEIIAASDYLLLDRGDLSKEISITKIPLTQKIILARARAAGKGVFVATNLLESMIVNKNPTRAEVNDVINTILDGAYGLTLSAETAIGQHPMDCINMLNRLIEEAKVMTKGSQETQDRNERTINNLNIGYITNDNDSASLIKPHGGVLVNQVLNQAPDINYLYSLPKIQLNQNLQMDVEQIAIGTFSPLTGFMQRDDLQSVLDNMRLTSGDVWTIPLVLDISEAQADNILVGCEVLLLGDTGEPMAIMQVKDKYRFDKAEFCQKLYGTISPEHPGVRWVNAMQPVWLGGQINLIKRKPSEYKEYELTPRQVRKLFMERGWLRVVGFHTRNVIHRSHEFIQLAALNGQYCDGLFVHPVIGQKKPGDFNARYIIKSYALMMQRFYPKDKVIFAAYSTFSRYAGPREAVFTALCRKNFGCSHFIVGRDHTGVGDFYHPQASHEIFSQLPDIGIQPLFFDKVFYSKSLQKHIHTIDTPNHPAEDQIHISGTQARKMLEQKQAPPDWFMRTEISNIIINAINKGEQVFVPKDIEKQSGLVIWFTGLSGAGKTTIARRLKEELDQYNKTTVIIDGDDIRHNQHKSLGFSRQDIKTNNRLIAELAKQKSKKYDFVLVPIISPYAADREMAKSIINGNFIELFINASLDKCIERDVKGLYHKALCKEMNNLIGFSEFNPYEFPQTPDLEVKTDKLNVSDSVAKIINYLKHKNFLGEAV